MSQHVSDLPKEKTELPASEPLVLPVRKVRARLHRRGIIALFVLISLSLLFFSSQIVSGLLEVDSASTLRVVSTSSARHGVLGQRTLSQVPTGQNASTPITTPTAPFFTPNNGAVPTLQMPYGHYVLYQSITHLFIVSTTDGRIQPLYTPGYNYNQAVRPILTPDGRLLYSGVQGIWLTNVFASQPTQLVHFDANTTLTSLILSQDGETVAWSTEPIDGDGQTNIYVGSLASPQLVWQQSTLNCPCFRIFSFLNGKQANADTILLLTDDRGSSEAVQYGLWALDMTNLSVGPQMVMEEDAQQGPLTLASSSNTLLYSVYEGAVPVPTDGTVPTDVAALSYANSLSITTLNSSPVFLGNSQVILPEQRDLSNSAQYHWVTTPTFSPDGGTLAYVEFSSDSQPPYDRYSALYIVKISSSGNRLQVSKPVLVVTSTTNLLELGSWLDSHIVTLYGDGAIYALDVQDGSLATLAQEGGYLRTLGVID